MFDINFLAVLVAAIVPMAIGSIWYGPLFGKRWMALMELTEEDIKASFNPLKSYGGSFVGAVLTAYVIAFLLSGIGWEGWMRGAEVGAVCWLGFILTYGYQSVAFENKKVPLWVMSAGYNLVVLLCMGAILGAWQ